MPPGKTRITIRIDGDILEWFRRQVHEAGGGSYQTLIRAACGGWQVQGQGLEHSGASGSLQSVVLLFGCRAVFLAPGISQKYNYRKHIACRDIVIASDQRERGNLTNLISATAGLLRRKAPRNDA